MSLVSDTLDAARRLTALILDETAAMQTRAASHDLKAMGEAKAVLADRLEQLCDAMKRAGKAVITAEPAPLRDALGEAMQGLNAALADNGRILGRRKALSEGLIEAVLSEAKRQAGTQLSAYGRAAPRTEKAAAIACNTQA